MDLLQIKGKYDIQIVKLRDIADKVTQKNSACLVSETFTNSAEKGIISQEDYFERTITNNKNISGYYIVNPDDFVYNPRVSTLAPVGPINRNKLGRTGVISPLYLVFRVHNVEPGYLEWYFKSNAWHNFMLENGNTGARSDRFSISDTEFFSMPIPLPPMNVQKIIANTLDTLEIKINYAKVEAEKLRNFKSSMLTKMFPKEGKKVPEIRFEGFTDNWEQRKLIEYLEVSKKKNKDERYNKNDVLSVSGDYGIVNQIEFQGRSFAGASVANYGVVATGDVVYTKSPLKSNPYGIIKTNKGETGIVSTLYAIYKPLENTHPEFVQVYFEMDTRMNNYMRPLVNKGAKNDMKVSDENALKGDVIFPKKEEQIKISEYFSSLDNLITLHQRKYEKLLDVKKAMLSKLIGGAN